MSTNSDNTNSIDHQLRRIINGLETGTIHDEVTFERHAAWYLDHLRRRLQHCIERPNESPWLQRLLSAQSQPDPTPMTVDTAMSAFVKIAHRLSTDSSLGEILAELHPAVRPSPESNRSSLSRTIVQPDDYRVYQAIFKAISWILMLYTTNDDDLPDQLRLAVKDPKNGRKHLRCNAWRQSARPINDYTADLSFEHLLNTFGVLHDNRLGPISQDRRRTDDAIISNDISNYILVKIAQVNVVWVDSLSLHLDYDARTSTLAPSGHTYGLIKTKAQREHGN